MPEKILLPLESKMELIMMLDFDGVLFNSAYEAYQVCELVSQNDSSLRRGIHFEEFMEFRAQLTDAWQFNRLYDKQLGLKLSLIHI